MSEGPQRSVLDAAAGVVRELRVFGVPTVLWTIIFCIAMWRADQGVLDKLFPWLYWTWLGLCGVSVVSAVVTSFVAWLEQRRHRLVPVAVPSPSSSLEPAANQLAMR